MQQGKLIVIDGADNVGKATQVSLLSQRLTKEGKKVGTFDFPQYERNKYGALIKECLQGEHGDFLDLDPKIASTLYAVDRFESKARLMDIILENDVVLLDRYVSANMLHQGAKITNVEKRKEFVDWLEYVEYQLFAMPKPDLTITLAVNFEHSDAMYKTMIENGEKNPDIAEEDREHQRMVAQCVEWFASVRTDWHTLHCSGAEDLRSREEIHEEIYFLVSRIL